MRHLPRFFRLLQVAGGIAATLSAISSAEAQVAVEKFRSSPSEAGAASSLPASPTDEGSLSSSGVAVELDAPNDLPTLEVNPGSAVSAVPKRFQYAVRLAVRGVFDDNIYLRHTQPIEDFYFAIEPGISLGFGDIVGAEMNSIRLDYAPSIFLYGENSAANAVQHLVRLEARYRFAHLSLGLTQEIQLLEGANPVSGTAGFNLTPTINLDTGGNTSVNIYNTRATFSYDLTGKTFASGGVNFSASEYDVQLISSQQIQGNLFLNYIYSPKLTFGLGGTLGYNAVEGPSPDQTFEQINLRLTYQLSGKVSLDGSAGLEWRQFDGTLSSETNLSPVYELGLSYQPFDGTTVSLQGSRRTQNSAVFAGQDYSTSSINLSVRQRFLRRLYLGVAGGYERSDYFNTVALVSATRSDDYLFVQPSIDLTLTRYWTAGIYYLHRRDDSSFETYSFHDNQFGLRTSLSF